MARGGARAGAGRPRKGEVRAPKVRDVPQLPPEVPALAAAANQSPLDYMLKVMRDAEEDPVRRDRMAMAAAPFVHARAGDAGKKADRAAAARTAESKFRPTSPPLRLAKG